MKAKNLKGLFSKLSGYGDDALRMASNYGDEALDYGLDIGNAISRYDDDVARAFNNDIDLNVLPNRSLYTTEFSGLTPPSVADTTVSPYDDAWFTNNVRRNYKDNTYFNGSESPESAIQAIFDTKNDTAAYNMLSEYRNRFNISDYEDPYAFLRDPAFVKWGDADGSQFLMQADKFIDTLPELVYTDYNDNLTLDNLYKFLRKHDGVDMPNLRQGILDKIDDRYKSYYEYF